MWRWCRLWLVWAPATQEAAGSHLKWWIVKLRPVFLCFNCLNKRKLRFAENWEEKKVMTLMHWWCTKSHVLTARHVNQNTSFNLSFQSHFSSFYELQTKTVDGSILEEIVSIVEIPQERILFNSKLSMKHIICRQAWKVIYPGRGRNPPLQVRCSTNWATWADTYALGSFLYITVNSPCYTYL